MTKETSNDDPMLETWRSRLAELKTTLSRLKGNPPAVHHTTQEGPANAKTADEFRSYIAQLESLIREREAKLA